LRKGTLCSGGAPDVLKGGSDILKKKKKKKGNHARRVLDIRLGNLDGAGKWDVKAPGKRKKSISGGKGHESHRKERGKSETAPVHGEGKENRTHQGKKNVAKNQGGRRVQSIL